MANSPAGDSKIIYTIEMRMLDEKARKEGLASLKKLEAEVKKLNQTIKKQFQKNNTVLRQEFSKMSNSFSKSTDKMSNSFSKSIDKMVAKNKSGTNKIKKDTKKATTEIVGSFQNMAVYLKKAFGLALAYGAMRGIMRELPDILYRKAAQQELVERKLEQALSNVTTARKEDYAMLKKQASALQSLTTYGDEQIINMQSMLATFQLSGKEIKQLAPRILDMATGVSSLGETTMDTKGATLALGKAFTSGIGMLSRYGVAMTEADKKLFLLADKEEKVKILTRVLDDNFKGLAVAAGTTAAGGIAQMQNVLGDLEEEIGFKMLPTVNTFTKSIKDIAWYTADWLRSTRDLNKTLKEIRIENLEEEIRNVKRYIEIQGTGHENISEFLADGNIYIQMIKLIGEGYELSGKKAEDFTALLGVMQKQLDDLRDSKEIDLRGILVGGEDPHIAELLAKDLEEIRKNIIKLEKEGAKAFEAFTKKFEWNDYLFNINEAIRRQEEFNNLLFPPGESRKSLWEETNDEMDEFLAKSSELGLKELDWDLPEMPFFEDIQKAGAVPDTTWLQDYDDMLLQLSDTQKMVAESMTDNFSRFFEATLEGAENFGDVLDGLWKDILRSFIHMLSQMLAKAIATKLFTTILSLGMGAGGFTTTGSSMDAAGLPFAMGTFPFKTGGSYSESGTKKELPKFDTGGSFTGSGSRGFPAILHPKEYVFPENYMRKLLGTMGSRFLESGYMPQPKSYDFMKSAGGGSPTTIQVNIYSPDLNNPRDLDMIANKVSKAMVRLQRGRVS